MLMIIATSTISFAVSNESIWISAGGYDVLKIRTGSTGIPITERAEIIQKRMNTLIGMKTSIN